MLKPFKLLTTTLMLCSLASFNLTAEAAEKLLIPLGKSVSIPAYGVKKILAVKDDVVDVLNVSDDEIILFRSCDRDMLETRFCHFESFSRAFSQSVIITVWSCRR